MTLPTAPTSADRLLRSLRNVIQNELPTVPFHGIYEFSVQAVHGSAPNATVDCSPTDSSIGLPSLSNITMRSSVDGGTSEPTPGHRCLVAFINGDASRPVVVGNDANAVNVSLDASSTLNLGGSSSTVNVGGSAGSVTLGPLPQALAHSIPVGLIVTALDTAATALSTYAAAAATLESAMAANTLPGPVPPASTFTTFAAAVMGPAGAAATAATAAATACTALAAAITTNAALIPTTVVTGT